MAITTIIPKIARAKLKLLILRMKYILSLALLSILAIANSQTLKYSKVKIHTNSQGLQQLAELGLAVDHGEIKAGTFLISDFGFSAGNTTINQWVADMVNESDNWKFIIE